MWTSLIIDALLLPVLAWILQKIARGIGAANPRYLRVLFIVILQALVGGAVLLGLLYAFMKNFPDFDPDPSWLAVTLFAIPFAALGLTAATRALLGMKWGMAFLLQIISLAIYGILSSIVPVINLARGAQYENAIGHTHLRDLDHTDLCGSELAPISSREGWACLPMSSINRAARFARTCRRAAMRECPATPCGWAAPDPRRGSRTPRYHHPQGPCQLDPRLQPLDRLRAAPPPAIPPARCPHPRRSNPVSVSLSGRERYQPSRGFRERAPAILGTHGLLTLAQ